jgi:hypothetical protein
LVHTVGVPTPVVKHEVESARTSVEHTSTRLAASIHRIEISTVRVNEPSVYRIIDNYAMRTYRAAMTLHTVRHKPGNGYKAKGEAVAIMCRLTPADFTNLRRIAAKQQVPLAHVIRDAVARYQQRTRLMMDLVERLRWRRAAIAARIAMGDRAATNDPLAWWCLTELLHAQTTAKEKKK